MSEEEKWFLKEGTARAEATINPRGSGTVLKGSKVSRKTPVSDGQDDWTRKRETLEQSGVIKDYAFTRDVKFSHMADATAILLSHEDDWKYVWKDKDGNSWARRKRMKKKDELLAAYKYRYKAPENEETIRTVETDNIICEDSPIDSQGTKNPGDEKDDGTAQSKEMTCERPADSDIPAEKKDEEKTTKKIGGTDVAAGNGSPFDSHTSIPERTGQLSISDFFVDQFPVSDSDYLSAAGFRAPRVTKGSRQVPFPKSVSACGKTYYPKTWIDLSELIAMKVIEKYGFEEFKDFASDKDQTGHLVNDPFIFIRPDRSEMGEYRQMWSTDGIPFWHRTRYSSEAHRNIAERMAAKFRDCEFKLEY